MEPEVPIEIPHHHVEVTRAIYKSAAGNKPVKLPLEGEGRPVLQLQGSLHRYVGGWPAAVFGRAPAEDRLALAHLGRACRDELSSRRRSGGSLDGFAEAFAVRPGGVWNPPVALVDDLE